jgi:FKBP-type peptidyl-prolyl cis-trans isomerase
MTKTARLAVFLWLSALAVGCGSSEDDAENAREGAAAERDPRTAPEDVQAPPADAEFTSSGLASRVIEPGTGTLHPAPADTVRVHYSGWTTNGRLFDSSYNGDGQPSQFPLNRVIQGWTEGLQLMVEGELRRFWIPAELAYGDDPEDEDAPAGDLTFDVELLEIIDPP